MEINSKFLNLLNKLGTLDGITPATSIELSNDIKDLREAVFSRFGITEGTLQEEYDRQINSLESEDCFRFKDVLSEMLELYKRKNHDYGNSFSKTIEEFGYIPAVARISDKTNRLKQLVKGESMQIEEPMRDTLIDIANYCILTILELDKPKE